MDSQECQSMQIRRMSNGDAKLPPLSLFQRFKLELRRRLPHKTYKRIQKVIDRYLLMFSKSTGHEDTNSNYIVSQSMSHLESGDFVRVRSAKEIQTTLNRWKEYKGCGFMDDMWDYCDSKQRVLKPVRRFVDERDYQVKKVKGIVLLEGLTCQGTPILGRCDRNCHYFWREEWLEKIDQNQGPNC